jgi:hypothetical protein
MLTRITVAVTVLCLVLPTTSLAQGFVQGDKEILLNGTGVSDKDFDSTVFSVQGSLGYFLTKNIEVAHRGAYPGPSTSTSRCHNNRRSARSAR